MAANSQGTIKVRIYLLYYLKPSPVGLQGWRASKVNETHLISDELGVNIEGVCDLLCVAWLERFANEISVNLLDCLLTCLSFLFICFRVCLFVFSFALVNHFMAPFYHSIFFDWYVVLL